MEIDEGLQEIQDHENCDLPYCEKCKKDITRNSVEGKDFIYNKDLDNYYCMSCADELEADFNVNDEIEVEI